VPFNGFSILPNELSHIDECRVARKR
jgi:hypothetical protein